MNFLDRLGIPLPIIQAPMAGVSTPALAAAVSNSGALGSIGIGATDAAGAADMVKELRKATTASFNVNVFVHPAPSSNDNVSAAWCDVMGPVFREFGAEPPETLRTIYKSFAHDDAMFRKMLDLAPPVLSFHFGLPTQEKINALKTAGCLLLATATNLTEAKAAEDAGIDGLVAQGYEAGGHRGMFDLNARDEQLSTHTLTRLLVKNSKLPVIAAGGIMDGAGIRAVLDLGAVAAQLGTAFIDCPESAADEGYRAALKTADKAGTTMTSSISGRPARCLVNRFTRWAEGEITPVPDYPIAYDAGKMLNNAAKNMGENGFGAQWAGQGALMIRSMPASQLIATLAEELSAAS